MDKWMELVKPFDDDRIKFKLQSKSRDGRQGLFVPYIDARDVMERLDEVLGPEGWHDRYDVQQARLVHTDRDGVTRESTIFYAKCALTILTTTKEDVGEGDSPKAAVSDALKRTAVKFGIGRHLYEGSKVWAPIDEYGNPLISRDEMLAIWKGEKEQVSVPTTTTSTPITTPPATTTTTATSTTPKAVTGQPASSKQIGYLRRLLKDIGLDKGKFELFIGWFAKKNNAETLTKQLASELIELAKENPEELKDLIDIFDVELEMGEGE